MLGWFFKTLRSRLNAEEKKWRSLNRVRNELGPRFWHSSILRIAANPMGAALIFFVVATTLAFLAAVVDPKLWVIYFVTLPDRFDPGGHLSTLFAVQATVVGLVYPIVISFVTLLLVRGNNAKAALHIYLHNSAALVAGLSALLLIAEMGLQYSAVPYVSYTTLITWISIDAVWFAINIFLTTYFLLRTFEFIQPSRRHEIVRRYAVGVAWPREARFHLASHFFRVAVEEKLLPGPSYGNVEGKVPSVLPGYIGITSGTAIVSRNLRSKRQLKDVRFRLLAWATRRWLARANAAQLAGGKASVMDRMPNIVIAFPLDPFSTYEGATSLCRVEGNVPVAPLERLLIRLSFVFGATKEGLVDLTVNDILLDVQAEAMEALRAGESEAFHEIVLRLLELYESLLEASLAAGTAGANASFTLVADRNHWMSQPIYVVWSRRFLDLFEAATSKLSLGQDYVRFLVHVPNRLFGKAEEKAVSEILKHFISLGPVLFRRIEDWWVMTIEQQGEIKHGACSPTILRPPFQGLHDKVIREFVGAWESLKNERIGSWDDDNSSWTKVQQSAEYFEEHLSHTLLMVADSVLRGDQNAAEWMGDILVKWFGELQFRFRGNQDYFLRRQRMITIDLLTSSWQEVERRVQVESLGVTASPSHNAVLSVCLNNLWTDICCVAIYVMLMWSKDCICDKSLPANICAALILGKPLRHGGHAVDGERPYASADELLIAILRQYYAEGGYRRGYRDRLDRYVERLADLSKSEMVSGRIYSSVGSNDLNSVMDGQLLALLLAVSIAWKPSREIEGILEDWSRTENDKIREFKRALEQWKTRLAQQSFCIWLGTYDCLRSKLNSECNFDTARSSVDEAIDHLLGVVTRVHEHALTESVPNEGRLNDIGRWASASAFGQVTAAFPLPLFSEVAINDRTLASYELVINGMKKGEFTEPPMADRATNEEDWLAESVRTRLAARVLAIVLDDLRPETINAGNSEAYWASVKTFASRARSQGLHPLLLLENPTIPRWLWDWIHPPFDDATGSVPPDVVITSDNPPHIDGYQCTLSGTPVYSTPIPAGASLLVMRESFEKIEFVRSTDGRYVKASLKNVEGHPTLVDLILAWQMKITARPLHAVRLMYGEKGTRGFTR